jgi:predicted NBD/HSP70 family sugar kinase
MLIKKISNQRNIPSTEAIRNRNRSQVLEAVRAYAPISRSGLAKKVSLSRATVSSIVKEMMELGLLRRAGQAASTGGRRPTLLGYHPQARMAVGVTMFDNEVKAVLTDLEGNPLKTLKTDWNGQQVEALIGIMIDTVRELCQAVDGQRILGIGVGLPGIVDASRGTIVEHVTNGQRIDGPIEVQQLMEEALGLPTVLTNRSRVAALSELQVGVGRGVNNMLYLFIGRGIVASVVLNGDPYLGPNFTAGEIGHNTVVPDGHLCGCGNRGCLEMYASDSAVVSRAIARARTSPNSKMRQAVGGNLQLLSTDVVIQCARDGDPDALTILNRTGQHLGVALSAAINILNPEMVVLGGPIGCKAGTLLIEPTIREIERHALSIPLANLRFVSGSEEANSAAIGAAVLALKETTIEAVFSLPENSSMMFEEGQLEVHRTEQIGS